MGLELKTDDEEDRWNFESDHAEKMNPLVESLRTVYADSLEEALKQFEFNFVISDPKLPGNPIVYVSEAFCMMSGYSADEVLGRNCRLLQGPDTDRCAVLKLRDAIQEERLAQVRILNYTKEGKPFWNLLRIAPVFSKSTDTVIHYVGVQTPVNDELAACRFAEKSLGSSSLCRPLMHPGPVRTVLLAIDEVQERDDGFCEQECRKADNGDVAFSRIVNLERKPGRVWPISDEDMSHGEVGTERISTSRLSIGGSTLSGRCKLQDPNDTKAAFCTRRVVYQLVECSKGSGEVLESRDKQRTEGICVGVVSSSLLLALSRIQQSFVLVDPGLPNAPVVHASDLFLHLTGYNRDEVMGRNCRFLQGPGTDPASVTQVRESMQLAKPRSVRLLNYRKDKQPFWNLLHIAPIRSSRGQVTFFVGVQLEVSAADEENESAGLSAHLKQLSAVGAVRVAVRSLQGAGLLRR